MRLFQKTFWRASSSASKKGWQQESRRFLREARLLSKLNHPGICQVYDLVENDGDQFLILEYVDGVSLKEEATRNLDHHRILQIILETAEALEAAHREQIILHQLLTGSSPYGEGLTTMELLIRVSEARTLPIEGLDTDVITLISDLTARSPEDRPSAAECASRIRSILAKPEQLRRRRIIVALSVVAGAALLVAAGVTMSQQWRVRRQARLAREFAEKASSVEWLMRAEHLAPPHDLTNARRQVRTTIAELEARVSGIDDQNAAPGHAAIGRAWASLGDDRKATDSLEMAWRLGMRTPQLSCALGRSLGALYDQALRETYRVSDPQLRQEAVEEAQGKYREPALNHLKRCRGDPNLP